MLSDTESRLDVPALQGLAHLRANVKDWDAAVQALSFTAVTIAESVGAAASSAHSSTLSTAQDCDAAQGFSSPGSLPPALPQPVLVLSASQLKPGRLFIVSNLRGAYYTLVELLSRHKFDFRSDNLMHLGNLVAPPPPLTMATTQGTVMAATTQHHQIEAAPALTFGRNTVPLLKLMRRHGGLGPMGVNECLTLLTAARANRQRAEEERRAQQQQQQSGAVAGRLQGRYSALSLQIAAAGAVAEAIEVPPTGLATPARGSHPALGSEGAPRCALAATTSIRTKATTSAVQTLDWSSDSEGSDSDSSASGSGSGTHLNIGKHSCMVLRTTRRDQAPASPTRDRAPASPTRDAAPPSPLPAPPASTPFPVPRCGAFGGVGGGGCRNTGADVGGLDDADLAHLISMPASILIEPYGIVLQHAAPPDYATATVSDSGCGGQYHVIYSHRRGSATAAAGAGATADGARGGGCSATATGLSSCRNVVRCAVLPPLRTLQRKSPGFAARAAGAGGSVQIVAAGVAPRLDELMLEVVEEPLSELDLPPPPQALTVPPPPAF